MLLNTMWWTRKPPNRVLYIVGGLDNSLLVYWSASLNIGLFWMRVCFFCFWSSIKNIIYIGLMIFNFRFVLPADFSSRFAYYRCTLLFSGAHLQNTLRFNWIYLHRCQFFHRYYFVTPVPIFSANDFVKKKWFFIPIYLNNDNKISVLTVPVPGIFIAEKEIVSFIFELWSLSAEFVSSQDFFIFPEHVSATA